MENLNIYKSSKNYGQPFTFTSDSYDQFLLTTLKNVIIDNREVGFIAVTENAKDVKAVINERKVFIVRTAILVGIVIIIFSFVTNPLFKSIPASCELWQITLDCSEENIILYIDLIMNNRVLLKKLVGENPGPRPDIEAINGIFKIKQIIPKRIIGFIVTAVSYTHLTLPTSIQV